MLAADWKWKPHQDSTIFRFPRFRVIKKKTIVTTKVSKTSQLLLIFLPIFFGTNFNIILPDLQMYVCFLLQIMNLRSVYDIMIYWKTDFFFCFK